MGVDPLALTERASVTVPAGIGRIESDLPNGVSDVWDESSRIDIFMPGETLASFPQSAIEAGRNWLLIEREQDWEALAWTTAEMTDEARWTLSGLWRGLAGTEPLAAPRGAVAVIADQRLMPLRVSARDVGAALLWQIAESDLQSFTYRDVAGRFSAPT